jgi:hypothetical protein
MRKNGNRSANHHHQQSQLPPTPPHQQSSKGNSSSSNNKPSILHARSKSVNSIAIPEHDVVPDSSAAASSSTMTAHIAASSSDPTQRIQYYASGCTELATETPVTLTRLEAVRFALRI